MATIIDQRVALDEALVPSTHRLRIGRSNFRLPYDIQSKESTLQAVYDVLPPKPKVSARKKKGDSASSTTPLTPTPTTIVMAAPRLSATAKGKNLQEQQLL
nr:hypothetical protein [Tanacetum cinerariifolium]